MIHNKPPSTGVHSSDLSHEPLTIYRMLLSASFTSPGKRIEDKRILNIYIPAVDFSAVFLHFFVKHGTQAWRYHRAPFSNTAHFLTNESMRSKGMIYRIFIKHAERASMALHPCSVLLYSTFLDQSQYA